MHPKRQKLGPLGNSHVTHLLSTWLLLNTYVAHPVLATTRLPPFAQGVATKLGFRHCIVPGCYQLGTARHAIGLLDCSSSD